MKRTLIALSVLVLAALACSLGGLPSASVTPVALVAEPVQQSVPVAMDGAQVTRDRILAVLAGAA